MVQPMFKGQTYGEATKQREAVRAVPTQAPPTEPAPPKRPRVTPGAVTPLSAPSARPMEPITAGANFGAGPNAMAAGIPVGMGVDPALEELKALYAAYPNDDLADLIDSYAREGF